ncbi:MAG: DUF3078 domain-containing protein [Bacteroidetes bacterium]|nr:DUF3078 domain-containing protein [Bacteroidota bacterium]
MKRTLLLAASLLIGFAAFAQTAPAPKDTTKKDTLWKIHGVNTILINQASFSNWAAGGVNAVALNVLFDYDFDYKKGKWNWDNKAIVGYGLSKSDGIGWRKNDDRLILNSLLGYQAAKYWLYTFYTNFQTQFTNGYSYDANNNRTLISGAFAPAYLTFGPGFAYKRSDSFRINISPFAARITFLDNDSLSNVGAFGVLPGHKSLFEFGASVDAYYKFNIAKNMQLENILKLYENYLKNPGNVYADYALNLYMKVNKLVTVNFGVEVINDPNALIPQTVNNVTTSHSLFQVKQIFGAGLTYKF